MVQIVNTERDLGYIRAGDDLCLEYGLERPLLTIGARDCPGLAERYRGLLTFRSTRKHVKKSKKAESTNGDCIRYDWCPFNVNIISNSL